MKKILAVMLLLFFAVTVHAEDGYRLWLRYDKIKDASLRASYKKQISQAAFIGSSATILAAREEWKKALEGLTGDPVMFTNEHKALLIAGKGTTLTAFKNSIKQSDLKKVGDEGFIILTTNTLPKKTIITANTDVGVLYGVFHFLKLLQTNQPISNLQIISAPKIKLRLLNHWDNLDRTVERGYSGASIWNWHTLPTYIDQRYIDYARANASIGINAAVLTNVNANALVLTPAYLQKVKALADVFRPYGIKVYLTARFSAPIEIGKLKTADPLNEEVKKWWSWKMQEIYQLIPDFGGFVVKANSEGQPGPQDYKRTHADGANMLADAIAPYKGIIMWRAFVYSAEIPDDRHKQAYTEFVPLDGSFRKNVMVQVKNGAIDFMPREPFHPLIGAMPKTPLLLELQVTQEYLGQGTHLAYLAPLFKECLQADTYTKGTGCTVAKVVDGSLDDHALSGMAGVANIGSDLNWTGHLFGQANWYALGRLAWDHELSSEKIAEEWLHMSFGQDAALVNDLKKIMLSSREIVVQYMNPLGLHHIMATGHHYGPGPWVSNLSRPEWNPVYYHKADSIGLGFDRTATGSNALSQYQAGAALQWKDLKTIDEKFLLWFHHVPWKHTMKSGNNLWDELCRQYNLGVDSVRWMQQSWNKQAGKIDAERFKQVQMLLNIQEQEAVWWRDACLLYFQTFSKMPIPAKYEQPKKTLQYYQQLEFPYAPGN